MTPIPLPGMAGSGNPQLAYRVITNITGRPRVARGIGNLSCP